MLTGIERIVYSHMHTSRVERAHIYSGYFQRQISDVFSEYFILLSSKDQLFLTPDDLVSCVHDVVSQFCQRVQTLVRCWFVLIFEAFSYTLIFARNVNEFLGV